MKTLQELYKEILASDELKKAFLEAAEDGRMVEFIKAQGCDATEEDLKVFVKEQAKSRSVSDEELDNVAGGTCNERTAEETKYSLKTLGAGCAAVAILSVALGGHSGQKTEYEGRLCNQ